MKRKIAVILAAGIDRYKERIARDEEGTLRRLVEARRVLGEAVGRHDGRIFNTAGDALLAEFQSAVEAVRCACHVQRQLRDAAKDDAGRLHYVIGINIGDVIQQGGDLLGDGVNVAARLQGLAGPGGICISRPVVEHVTGKLPLCLVDAGFHALKNIPEPVHAFRVDLDGKQTSKPTRAYREPSRGLAVPVALAAVGALVIGGALLAVYGRRPAAAPQPEVVVRQPGPAPVQVPDARAKAQRCAEILERAQLGKLTREDRQVLQGECN